MGLANVASLFTGTGQSGQARFYGLSTAKRYRRIPSTELIGTNLWEDVGSATIHNTGNGRGVLLLFGIPSGLGLPSISFSDYSGPFVQVTNAEEVGDFSGDVPPDAVIQSALVVGTQRRSELRRSFRGEFLDDWIKTIDAKLGEDAERDGDPLMTWEAFPVGISHLNHDHMYLKIHQKITVLLSGWADYAAEITYHLRIVATEGGGLRGWVQRWAYWIEAGPKSDNIAEVLEPKVINGMNTINSVLAAKLAGISGVSALYFLPGTQLTPEGTDVITGSAWDDVTIVAQL